jgi:hypothetical protein
MVVDLCIEKKKVSTPSILLSAAERLAQANQPLPALTLSSAALFILWKRLLEISNPGRIRDQDLHNRTVAVVASLLSSEKLTGTETLGAMQRSFVAFGPTTITNETNKLIEKLVDQSSVAAGWAAFILSTNSSVLPRQSFIKYLCGKACELTDREFKSQTLQWLFNLSSETDLLELSKRLSDIPVALVAAERALQIARTSARKSIISCILQVFHLSSLLGDDLFNFKLQEILRVDQRGVPYRFDAIAKILTYVDSKKCATNSFVTLDAMMKNALDRSLASVRNFQHCEHINCKKCYDNYDAFTNLLSGARKLAVLVGREELWQKEVSLAKDAHKRKINLIKKIATLEAAKPAVPENIREISIRIREEVQRGKNQDQQQ